MRYNIQILLLLIFNSYWCFSQSTEEEKIDSLFSYYSLETPGVAVAVVSGGNVVFKKGYGMANLEYEIPITPKTVFHIASVSKQFTTFAVYLLEEEGKISMDDDIRKYIPEIPDFGKPITIKHLCSHTSGLKDQWALLTLAGWRMDDVITTNQILKLISAQETLNFPPGTQFQYSNTGFTLLAKIVNRVTGISFPEYVRRNILQPLDMNNSQFYDNYEKIVKNRAYSYAKENGLYEKRKLNYSNVGPTSLFTTVEDLAKWTMNFENPIIGTNELIKRYNEVSLLENGEPAVLGVMNGETIYHAKGQFTRNYKGLTLYNHTGGDAGFKTYLARFPEKDFSVILLSNDNDFDRLGNGLKIAELYLKDDLKKREEQPIPEIKSTKKSKAFSTELSDFEGLYYSPELTTTYEIQNSSKGLKMLHRRLRDVELVREAENTFSGKIWFSVNLEFLRNDQNQVVGFNLSNFGAKNVSFNKISNNLKFVDNPVAVQLINDQLSAYNSRNIDRFILPYDKDVKIFNFPNDLYGSGIDFIKENYTKIFSESPNLSCQILNRIILGNTVIDHERISGLRNMETFEAIVIYKFENQKIAEVYFIRKDN